MYAGTDPLTGKEIRLVRSTKDPKEAERILDRMRVEVAERESTRTKATLSAALDSWLQTHEGELSTIHSYESYIRHTIRPALGDVPVANVTVQTLERLYAELRRCSRRCQNGKPAIDHRTPVPHACRIVQIGRAHV